MLLAVDVGNTQTVLGLFDSERLAGHWRIASNAGLTGDELRVQVGGLLQLSGLSWDDVSEVILSSVVPRLTAAWEDAAEEQCGCGALVVGPGLKTGMPIRYDNPHEVGADRIVNGVAAYEVHGGPVVVVDFGTATTIDVISEDGAYLGGAIAPGVETSAEALFSKAARLSKVDLEAPDRVIGTNTRASVQAGLLLGEAAMVDGLVRRVWGELGRETPVVATGGLAPRMAPLCETVSAVNVDLTIEGLRLIRERNR
ncbi:MAG TPA: type III pantothenate kinase [Coriobacteriia bacterium]|nr:type III pantothenate kinase [Coriobacteriia bacterium]